MSKEIPRLAQQRTLDQFVDQAAVWDLVDPSAAQISNGSNGSFGSDDCWLKRRLVNRNQTVHCSFCNKLRLRSDIYSAVCLEQWSDFPYFVLAIRDSIYEWYGSQSAYIQFCVCHLCAEVAQTQLELGFSRPNSPWLVSARTIADSMNFTTFNDTPSKERIFMPLVLCDIIAQYSNPRYQYLRTKSLCSMHSIALPALRSHGHI